MCPVISLICHSLWDSLMFVTTFLLCVRKYFVSIFLIHKLPKKILLYYAHALDEWIVKFRHQSWKINPLSVNLTNWSNTLKRLVGCCWRTVWVCLTILLDWHLKGQHKTSEFYTHFPRVYISVSHNSYVFLWTYENGFSEVFRVCENEIHEPLPKTPKKFL